jgi:hypothetical protein
MMYYVAEIAEMPDCYNTSDSDLLSWSQCKGISLEEMYWGYWSGPESLYPVCNYYPLNFYIVNVNFQKH